jgi:hypothetical protein
MVDADKAEFRRCVEALALNFGKAIPAELFELLFSGMRSMPLPAVKQGFRRALETCKFFPTVAELRRLSREAFEEHQATQVWDPAKALGAWDNQKPEVGGFRKYLRDLAERKSLKGDAHDPIIPGPVAVVPAPVVQAPAGRADGDGVPGGDGLRSPGGAIDLAQDPTGREPLSGGGR